jgi:hypothetical protein
MPQGILQLSDEDFFNAPFKTRDGIEDPLMAQEKDALIADAPRTVVVDVRKRLPLVVIRVAHFALAAGVRFDHFGIVVAAEPKSGKVRVGQAVTPPEKSVVNDEEPRQGEGMTGSAQIVDVRAQLDLPWRPSELLLSLIVREEISEPLHVKLVNSPGAYHDEAIETQRQKDLMAAPLPAVRPAPGKTLPAYGKVDGAPAVPEEPGLLLSAERVMKLHSNGPLVLKGSFRVKLPKQLLVDAARAEPLADPKPAALVPITLVITASVAPVPFVYDLMVPSWSVKDGVAAGSFAVDLDKVGTVRTVPRTLFIYGFTGDQRFGPLPIGMAGEEE